MSAQKSISFLGEQFSYHHLAAMAFWGEDNNFISATNFDTIIKNVTDGVTEFGILAVENSLAGDVPGNFELLTQHPIQIIGEICLKIRLQLGAIPGATIFDIITVYSHKMAIKETTHFFSAYPQITCVETNSTSGAMKIVTEANLKYNAAIGSGTALAHYNLKVLSANIDNSEDNRTRFLMISRNSGEVETTKTPVKASLHLQLSKEGKQPELEKNGNYEEFFSLTRPLKNGDLYAEMDVTNISQIDNIRQKLEGNSIPVRVLGIYPPGKTESGL